MTRSFVSLTFLVFLATTAVGHPHALARRKEPKELKTQQDGLKFDIDNLPNPDVDKKDIDVPADCKDRKGDGEKCADGDELEALEVTFKDWNKPQNICRCKKADLSMDDIVKTFGHVPVGLRQYVKTAMVIPGGDGGAHALTYNDGFQLYWEKPSQRTWIHEATHAADFNKGWGASQDWSDAIDKDTCVPDKYAQTSKGEDLAQVSVVKVSMVLNNGKMPDGLDQDCMKNQLDFLDKQDTYKKENLVGK